MTETIVVDFQHLESAQSWVLDQIFNNFDSEHVRHWEVGGGAGREELITEGQRRVLTILILRSGHRHNQKVLSSVRKQEIKV
jgi:hypothetical protein